MTTIAHLSDLHLLEEGHERRAPAARARLHFLSFGRPAHAARVARLLERLQRAVLSTTRSSRCSPRCSPSREHAELGRLLLEHDHAHVIHGHTHARVDEPVRGGAAPRIFSVESVVAGRSPLRVYGVRHGRVWAEPEPKIAGVPNFALTL